MRKRLTAALLLGSLMGAGHAQVTYTSQGVPVSGSTIQNVGVLSGQNDDGTPMSMMSNVVEASVAQVAGADLKPDGTATSPNPVVTAMPDETAVFTYVLTNTGNGEDTFTLAFDSGTFQGSYVSPVIQDTNGNGMLDQDGSDLEITSVTLQGGQDVRLFVPVLRNYNADPGVAGETNDFSLLATSTFDSSVSDTSVSRLINGASANFNIGFESNETVRLGQTVPAYLAIFNNGNVPLAGNLRLTETQSAASTTRYDAGYGAFDTPQEAFDAYLAANPAGIPVGGRLYMDVTNRLDSASGNQPAITQVQVYTTEPAPARNTFTSASPNTVSYTLTLGTTNLQAHKEQAPCSVDFSGTLTCGATTAAPIDLPPCGVVYYRVRAQSFGSAAVGDLTITDVVPAELEMLWGRARTYSMNMPSTETSPGMGRLVSESLISVGGEPDIRGPVNLSGPGVEIRAYPADPFGNRIELNPSHELWLELFARVPGDNCASPTTPYPANVPVPEELMSS